MTHPMGQKVGQKIGVIGSGVIARTIHLPVLTSMPDVQVAWVADADDARGDRPQRRKPVEHLREPRRLGPLLARQQRDDRQGPHRQADFGTHSGAGR